MVAPLTHDLSILMNSGILISRSESDMYKLFYSLIYIIILSYLHAVSKSLEKHVVMIKRIHPSFDVLIEHASPSLQYDRISENMFCIYRSLVDQL
jgi:hypothetical protein